jgi:hypothetical protein
MFYTVCISYITRKVLINKITNIQLFICKTKPNLTVETEYIGLTQTTSPPYLLADVIQNGVLNLSE